MLNFSIVINAKDAKHALQIREQLLAAGVEEMQVSAPKTVIRAAAPNGGPREMGPREIEWNEKQGNGFRSSPKMRALFSLSEDRETMIGQMLDLLASGKIIKTVSGYAWKQSGAGHSAGQSIELPKDDNEETF